LKENKIYIYGFGNPGRQDDGLGPAIIDRLQQDNIAGIITDSNYQLNIEDAHNISGSDIVIFVDASIDAEEPFSFKKIEASNEITFTTHSMPPESVLALSKKIYAKDIEAYILAIRGYRWGFNKEFSPKAVKNFNAAYAFLIHKIKEIIHP
jgi:hydrogenase maturation protease